MPFHISIKFSIKWAVPVATAFAALPLGCAPRILPTPEAIPSLGEIAGRLQQEDGKLATLRATGVLRWKRQGKTGRADHAMVLKRPGMLRLEGFTPLGTSAYSLIIHDGEMEVFIPSEARVYRGPATPQTLTRYLSIPLGPAEAISVLCGRVPLCPHEDASVGIEDDSILLEVNCPSGWAQRVRLDHRMSLPTALSFSDPSGQRVLEVAWGEFQLVGDTHVPTRIRVEMLATGDTLSVALEEVEVNVSLQEGAFRPPLPPGTEVSPLP